MILTLVPHMIAKASLLFWDLLLDGAYRAHFYENLPYGARWWLPPRTANMCSVAGIGLLQFPCLDLPACALNITAPICP